MNAAKINTNSGNAERRGEGFDQTANVYEPTAAPVENLHGDWDLQSFLSEVGGIASPPTSATGITTA
jgi:hypothetical protein